jgi:hypothetical protein
MPKPANIYMPTELYSTIIMVTVWWGCDRACQDKGEQCAVIWKKVLKRICGTKEEKVTGRYRESLDDLP